MWLVVPGKQACLLWALRLTIQPEAITTAQILWAVAAGPTHLIILRCLTRSPAQETQERATLDHRREFRRPRTLRVCEVASKSLSGWCRQS